jgi:hypothetical protein
VLDGEESVTEVLFCAVECVPSILCRVILCAVCCVRYLLLQQSCVVVACLGGGTLDVALAAVAACVVVACLCCATHTVGSRRQLDESCSV